MKQNRGTFIIMVGLLAGLITGGQNVFAEKKNNDESIPYAELRTFSRVFERIKSDYVDTVDDETLLENAIRGMLAGLDPHSSFLDLEEHESLQESTAGEFGGLGIEVTLEDGFVKVVSPIDDTPAARAGVQSGDIIIRLNDKSVKGMSLSDAISIMRGKPGTSIDLTIIRKNNDKPVKLVIVREVIHVKSVRSQLLEKGYGYVRVASFQVKTGFALLEAIDQLKKENKEPLKGLILDLRNNPGGVLSAAVDVADAFLDSGLIVYTEGRTESAGMKYNATPGDAIDHKPLVVLVNSGSASASEIVAGAIQDHVRGIIMGKRTFGKGSVQSVLEFNNGSAMKLTTARYYTPGGRSIQAEGIQPDILLKAVRLEPLENEDILDPIKESSLAGHLDNPEAAGKNKEQKSSAEDDILVNDYELFEALNLLKGLTIYQTK